MSTNMSISGGNNIIPDRAFNRSEESGIGETTSEATLSADTSRMAAKMNNVVNLKEAEQKGAHLSISQEQVVKAIEQAIKASQGKFTSLEFSIHEDTKRIAVKVMDSKTGELIREVPPEKSLDFIAKMWEMAGLFIDEKR